MAFTVQRFIKRTTADVQMLFEQHLIFSRSVCNFKGILTSNGRTCQH